MLLDDNFDKEDFYSKFTEWSGEHEGMEIFRKYMKDGKLISEFTELSALERLNVIRQVNNLTTQMYDYFDVYEPRLINDVRKENLKKMLGNDD